MRGSIPLTRLSLPPFTNTNEALPKKLKDFLISCSATWYKDFYIIEMDITDKEQDHYFLEIYKEELVPLVKQFILENTL